tara:strand:+ start:419 stop:1138 length:720 start_codon:yes stop_codon:yes gene_type:complete
MSERNKLEQVLELLLAEDNERAEELLHEYVVETARAEYERILDEDEVETEESEEEAVEEAIDDSDPEADFVSDVEDTDAGIDDDEIGGFGSDEEAGEEEDLEDKVDSLEDELEDLRAEFEKLLSGEEEGDDEESMEPVFGDEEEAEFPEEESIEYDLDEEVEEDEEVVEEATKFSDTPAAPKGGEADSKESPFTKKPKATVVSGAGTPVKANDGGEGKKGESAKDHTPTNNIKVEPKKV